MTRDGVVCGYDAHLEEDCGVIAQPALLEIEALGCRCGHLEQRRDFIRARLGLIEKIDI